MSDDRGLVFGYLLDERGGGRKIGWNEIRRWRESDAPVWVHLDRSSTETRSWLCGDSGLDPVVAEALLAEETRPRAAASGPGMLLILRGVNLNPGADPEDMVAIRAWVDARRVITTRQRHVMAGEDVRTALAEGTGPSTTGELVVLLADRLVERMGPVMAEIDDRVDAFEDEVVEARTGDLRARIGALRRQAIMLRRYLAPQRDVLSRLQSEAVAWLSPQSKLRLREVADRLTRYVEDLDAARERAAVTQEELSNRLSEHMNRTMYILSLVASVFLPLGLLTGLLGINVGGIPFAENPHGFALVTVILLVIVMFQLWLFRRRHFL